MKIQGWFVERFGALRNYEVRDLPAGLTVFCGPNNSGKSTLFAFLRQMLYGPSQGTSGQRGAAFHDHGGWSGRLFCAGPDGTYTLVRHAGNPSALQVTAPDGSAGSESDLDRVFGGARYRSAGALLAFDIGDLQALPELPAWVRERLFPAGAGRDLRLVERALDAVHARRSAASAAAAQNLQRLPAPPVDLQARIDRSTRAASRLCQLLQSQGQARLTLDLRTRAIADLVAEQAKYDALVDLSPIWQDLAGARRELESIEAVDEFPIDSEQRLESALGARQAAHRTIAQLVHHERPARRQTAVALADPPGEGLPASDTRAGTVVRERIPLPELSAPASEDLSAWQRRLQDAVDAARDAERELDGTERTIRDLELARTEIVTTLSRPEPPSVAVLDEEARLVQHVRTTLAALTADQAVAKRWQDQIGERSATVRDLETQIVVMPSAVIVHLAWILALAGTVAGAWRYTLQDDTGVAAAAGLALLCAVGAVVQRARRRKAADEDDERRNQLASARGELERACQSLLQQQERAARRRFDISVDSVRLGLPPMPTDLQLKEREAEVEAHRRQRAEWDKAQEELAGNQAALARNQELRSEHMQAVVATQAHERQTIQQWHQWKVHAGLSGVGSSGRGAPEDVRSEAELVENCRRLRIQISEWEQSATDWNSRARAALTGASESEGNAALDVRLPDPADESPLEPPALQAARRRVRQCEESLRQLFAQAGVRDETSFRARLAAYRRRLALSQTIRTCETRLNERLRREESAESIRHELSDGRVEQWRDRAARAAADLTSLETSRDEALRQVRQIDADISIASAESADLPVLEAERAGLAAEAAAGLRAARTLAIAGSLLEDARRHVEREAQPAAFRRGSDAMAAITFSRYERLGAGDDGRSLAVFDARNGWTPADRLSRGTVEQLHFSLRVGLADDSSQCGAALPVIADDVLDHFDPKRSQAMARQLVELSRRHQVFVFTRRPETCELLRALDPAARVVEMHEL